MDVDDTENAQEANNNNNFSSLGAAAPVSGGSVPLPTPPPQNGDLPEKEGNSQEEEKMEGVIENQETQVVE